MANEERGSRAWFQAWPAPRAAASRLASLHICGICPVLPSPTNLDLSQTRMRVYRFSISLVHGERVHSNWTCCSLMPH